MSAKELVMLRIIRCPRSRSAPRRRPARVLPRVEGLEHRRLLATFNPLPSAADGTVGSLRAAVIAANTNGQDNTIVLQSGLYRLTIPNTDGQENAAAQGDLDLTAAGHTITIQGPGAGATIIGGGGLDRVFQVMLGVGAVLSDLTIQNGIARDGGASGVPPDTEGSFGGGILNAGTLELDRVVVQTCTAAGGPGKDATLGEPPWAGSGGYSALGGGIYNVGTLTINQSLIRDNTAEGGKGGDGILNQDPIATGGDGGAGFGGGIYNAGSMTMSQSTIAANDADGGHGGHGGESGSIGSAGGDGGPAYGGGVYIDEFAAQTLIVDSTIADNLADGGDGGPGGEDDVGFPGYGGRGGDGGFAEGGGIAALASFATDNSTIAGNAAQGSLGGEGGPPDSSDGVPGQPGDQGHGAGGGIWAPVNPGSPALATSISSLIAMNATDTSTFPDADAAFTASHTLIQVGDGATGVTDGVDGNLVGVDPLLGPLQDNGGPTPTMALLPGSPAIDAGSNPLNLTSDQRGNSPRVVGTAADIGAYELGASAPPDGGGNGVSQGGNGGGGSLGGNGSGAAAAPAPLEFSIVQHGWRRCIYVRRYPYSGWIRICLPLRWGHGRIQATSADIGGVEDLIVRRPLAHHHFATLVYSGIDGSPLTSRLA
jgi:hypothetical protein